MNSCGDVMKMLSIDIETYSSVDLRETGVYAYTEAKDFEILLIAYRFDKEPVTVIETYGVEQKEERRVFLEEHDPIFWKALIDEKVIKTAYNANFERTCLSAYYDLPMVPAQWRCTAVHAATLGLPRSLEEVGKALGLEGDLQKNKDGKALISYFCSPCKPTKKNGGRTRNLPEQEKEKWELFKEYNKQDVIAEGAIAEKLKAYPIIEEEQKLWNFDQRMNDRGILLDMDFVKGIIEYDMKYQEKLLKEAVTITGLKNPNSPTQLKGWLEREGLVIESLTKDTVREYLAGDLPDHLRRALEIRQAMSKTSTKKYQAMRKAVCLDRRLRGVLQFYGANRTGRWAGRMVQVHNLPQNKIPDIELARELVAKQEFELVEMLFGETPFIFSQLIRTAFVPSKGNRFIVSDFSAIEARVISWLAGEEWRLEVFKTHGKIYEASASQMFHVPIEEIGKGSPLRQKGKVAELALGYQGGVGALLQMGALEMGILEEELPTLVSSWREANSQIVKLWRKVESAAKTTIKEQRAVRIQQRIEFQYKDGILFIQLPGGRRLSYYNARLTINEKGMEQITYAGVQQTTKTWGSLVTYGGKLVENIVQGIARDCLAVAMMRVEKAGYQIVLHIHDELVVDVPYEDQGAAGIITEIMSEDIKWAKGLPLKGDTYETKFYKKD